MVRLHQKGGKRHEAPAHHNADEYLDSYLNAAGTIDQKKAPFFRTIGRSGRITERGMTRNDALRMVKRRMAAAGLSPKTSCHSFRATGIPRIWTTAAQLKTHRRSPPTNLQELRSCMTEQAMK